MFWPPAWKLLTKFFFRVLSWDVTFNNESRLVNWFLNKHNMTQAECEGRAGHTDSFRRLIEMCWRDHNIFACVTVRSMESTAGDTGDNNEAYTQVYLMLMEAMSNKQVCRKGADSSLSPSCNSLPSDNKIHFICSTAARPRFYSWWFLYSIRFWQQHLMFWAFN